MRLRRLLTEKQVSSCGAAWGHSSTVVQYWGQHLRVFFAKNAGHPCHAFNNISAKPLASQGVASRDEILSGSFRFTVHRGLSRSAEGGQTNSRS
ncbi:hypothetical protein BaRGS_00016190 [Batillaria attramentaria]|uniref:Uncharacterized protein n=1 Tax=Batillaria attramentaria TaxID=370345 RepID=A0ABD0KZ60_9CAEN